MSKETTPEQFYFFEDTITANGTKTVVLKIPRYLIITYFSFQTSGAIRITPKKNELLQKIEDSGVLEVDGNLELKSFRYQYRSELEFELTNTEGVDNKFIFIIGVRRD